MAYIWLIGFSNVVPGFSGRYKASSPSVNVSSLKTASGFGVTVLSKRASTAKGTKGVGVIVGVFEIAGVRVIVGVREIVGVRVMVGVMVMVGVSVGVTVGE